MVLSMEEKGGSAVSMWWWRGFLPALGTQEKSLAAAPTVGSRLQGT